MKLTTDKALIVFYDGFNAIYKLCGVKYFKQGYNDRYSVPVLYTDSIWVAMTAKHNLNKGLQA